VIFLVRTMALRLRQKMSSRLTLVRRFLILIDRLRLGFGFTVTASNLNSCCLSSGPTEIGVLSLFHSIDYRILRLRESSILSPYDHVGMRALAFFRNNPGNDDPCRPARFAAHAMSPNNKPAYNRGRSHGRRRQVILAAIRGGGSCSVETARQNQQEFPVARPPVHRRVPARSDLPWRN
jgi:hypothetical protein